MWRVRGACTCADAQPGGWWQAVRPARSVGIMRGVRTCVAHAAWATTATSASALVPAACRAWVLHASGLGGQGELPHRRQRRHQRRWRAAQALGSSAFISCAGPPPWQRRLYLTQRAAD